MRCELLVFQEGVVTYQLWYGKHTSSFMFHFPARDSRSLKHRRFHHRDREITLIIQMQSWYLQGRCICDDSILNDPLQWFCDYKHPWSLTWNLKISHCKRRFLLEIIILRFHVKIWGCIICIYIYTYGNDWISIGWIPIWYVIAPQKTKHSNSKVCQGVHFHFYDQLHLLKIPSKCDHGCFQIPLTFKRVLQ